MVRQRSRLTSLMATLTGFGQKRILMSLWQPLNPPPLLFSALGYLGLSFPQESGRDLEVYWERLRQLRYDFLQSDRASEIGLRFTLSVPGAHTAIPGTTNPEHLLENARYAAEGPLPGDQFEAIRSTWSKISKPSWIGQV